MSYILDALKKSDQERKQGDVPNLQTVHIPISTQPQSQWALYGLIGFLLLVLAFVIGMMISNKETVGVVHTADIKGPVVVDVPANETALDAEARAVVSAPPKAEQQTKVAQETPSVKDVQPEMDIKQIRVEVAHTKELLSPNELVDIPYLNELPDYKQQSVPEMSFAGHVFSSSPVNRSVIINGSMMSEGDTLVQGIDVVEITAGGVVFSLHGELFRMDILQNWSFE